MSFEATFDDSSLAATAVPLAPALLLLAEEVVEVVVMVVGGAWPSEVVLVSGRGL